MAVAGNGYEHQLLLEDYLISGGVSEKGGGNDACAMEHILSEETMECIRQATLRMNGDDK